MSPKMLYPFLICNNFLTSYDILNLFGLFEAEFKHLSIHARIN